MASQVFDFSDYKAVLEARASSSQGRGFKGEMASAASVQPAYLSQVLRGNAHLSLEQAQAVGEFLGHTVDENHFFLLLVQKDRAGNRRLKNYFEKQIDEVLKQRMQVSKRLSQETTLGPTEQAVYYSSWIYAAVHMAVSLKNFDGRDEIAKHLRVSPTRVAEVLEFLIAKGLVIAEEDKLRVGPSRVFLGNSSTQIIRHHSNWRQQAIDSLDRETERDLHYSSIFTLSAKDARVIKDRMLEMIKENLKIIQASPEEELCALTLDFFNLEK